MSSVPPPGGELFGGQSSFLWLPPPGSGMFGKQYISDGWSDNGPWDGVPGGFLAPPHCLSFPWADKTLVRLSFQHQAWLATVGSATLPPRLQGGTGALLVLLTAVRDPLSDPVREFVDLSWLWVGLAGGCVKSRGRGKGKGEELVSLPAPASNMEPLRLGPGLLCSLSSGLLRQSHGRPHLVGFSGGGVAGKVGKPGKPQQPPRHSLLPAAQALLQRS